MIFDRVKKIGEFLVENNIISMEMLDKALQIQEENGELLGEILGREFGISDDDIARYGVAKQLEVEFVDLKTIEELEPEVLRIIDQGLAEKFKVIPLKLKGPEMDVAMTNPQNVVALDELAIRTKLSINALLCSYSGFEKAYDQFYGDSGDEKMSSVMEELDQAYDQRDAEEVQVDEGSDEESAPIIRLANNVIEEAYKRGVSDIHIEPFEQELLVRYRQDGMLHKVLEIPKHALNALVSRFKIMSNLNIAEKRIPQDGRIQFKDYTKGRIDIDLRVNTVPLVFGEKICMRILDKTATAVGLDKLGFSEYNLKVYKDIISKPYGMILHVGPTGSGKTTTLYSALNAINTPDVNIQTAEDPVEYMLQGINQLPVKHAVGLDFAAALRAFLRQDPDVIMVGEIRDLETASIAVEAALTGHLLISTLHTNDAAGTVTRMLDMGIEPFLLTGALLGVCAQRLLRRICKECKVEYTVTKKEAEEMGIKIQGDKETVWKGEGCPVCNGTGYKGRVGIHELLTLDDNVKKMILDNADAATIKQAAIDMGMIPIFEDGLAKARQGVTTFEEVLRVTRED